ncbi:hypothetical protein JTE90_016751 [Oedothorax gibbosus]|uniref:Reverse transcriptase domain-containing protein n=1 Tax=Oedothorax gibbosus TaxID=931172 RepID=A0AAV6VXT8_9ARAC|nr:hypothetical protein JTE90_016751 [Oedothorax gibbosus]
MTTCGSQTRLHSAVTEFDSYPIPHLHDFTQALHGKHIFSKLYIFKAFHQILIAEEDIPKTAEYALYEYTRLCFGVSNAPQTFMRFVHEFLRGLPFCYVLDDILCFSDNPEEHKAHLHYTSFSIVCKHMTSS